MGNLKADKAHWTKHSVIENGVVDEEACKIYLKQSDNNFNEYSEEHKKEKVDNLVSHFSQQTGWKDLQYHKYDYLIFVLVYIHFKEDALKRKLFDAKNLIEKAVSKVERYVEENQSRNGIYFHKIELPFYGGYSYKLDFHSEFVQKYLDYFGLKYENYMSDKNVRTSVNQYHEDHYPYFLFDTNSYQYIGISVDDLSVYNKTLYVVNDYLCKMR